MDNYEKLLEKVNKEHAEFRDDIAEEFKSKLDYMSMDYAINDLLNNYAHCDDQLSDICYAIGEGQDAYITIDEEADIEYLLCEENLTKKIMDALDADASMTVSSNLDDILQNIIKENKEIEKTDEKIKEVCAEYDTNTERLQALGIDRVVIEISNTNDDLRQRLADEGISNAEQWQDNTAMMVYTEDLKIIETALADNNVDYRIPALEPQQKVKPTKQYEDKEM